MDSNENVACICGRLYTGGPRGLFAPPHNEDEECEHEEYNELVLYCHEEYLFFTREEDMSLE